MRVGVIGTRWGMMHVGAFRAAGAEVVALCGRDLDKTRAIAHRERIALATDDIDQLIDASDIVVVASPDALHAAHVTRALSAGKAVLCEKPLAPTYAEAATLVALARAGRPTAVAFPYRALPSFIATHAWLTGRFTKEASRSGAGTRPQRRARIIVTVRSGFAWTSASGDLGGTSHVLDAVCWLAGAEPTHVRATLASDLSAFHITFANGTLAVVTWTLAPEPGLHGSWSIVADDRELGFTAGYVPARGGWCIGAVRVFDAGVWRDLYPAVTPQADALEPWAAAHYQIARDFMALIRGDTGETRLASFEDAARAQAILHAARSSAL